MFPAEIQQHIDDLPENIAEAITKFPWAQVCMGLVQKYNLQIDDIEAFRNQSILIATGITPAQQYQTLLVKNMDIDVETAEQLVADANEHIFRILQKKAFSHEEDEPEIPEHQEISHHLKSEGIILIDENTQPPKPNNALQNLADELLGSSPDEQKPQTTEGKQDHLEENTSQKNYQEEITDEDLLGIHQHRTAGVENLAKEITAKKNITQAKFTNSYIAKHDHIDLSPEPEHLAKEDGSFLKRIGADL